MSISNYLENALLDHVCGVAALTQPSGVFVKLHLGDPGEDGTANPAAETTRKEATFTGPASGGTIANDNAIQWTDLAAMETATHVSLWDAATGGNCLWTGALDSAASLSAGGTFTIAVGDLAISLE